MAKEKTPKVGPAADDPKLMRLIFEACRATGKLFASTESEVAREEERQKKSPLELPQRLRSPDAVWQSAQKTRESKHFIPTISTEIGDNLARAARQGKTIPKEVIDQMHRDRKKAEESKG